MKKIQHLRFVNTQLAFSYSKSEHVESDTIMSNTGAMLIVLCGAIHIARIRVYTWTTCSDTFSSSFPAEISVRLSIKAYSRPGVERKWFAVTRRPN